MRRSLGLYFRLISVSMQSQMQYRLSFLTELLSVGIITFASFATVALIMQRFVQVAGWVLGEIAFLYGTVETAFGIMDMLFGGFDPGTFGQQIRRGSFDQVLLRPVSTTIQVFGSEFTLRRLARIFQGFAVLIYSLLVTHIAWTPVKVVYLPVVIISLVCFFGALFIIGATITFWTVQSIEVINIFTYGGTEMMSYPMSIYDKWLRRFFTFIIPGIFMNYYPAIYILDKSDPLGLPSFVSFLSPIAGLGMMVAALAFWKFGIRHYQSTGT
jgi:ABC-2 type transport system permease protein